MTDERRDDEIIGRALSRAIETIDVNQTPFERSRIATAPARRSFFGLWQMASAAAVIVLALAIATWLTRPADDRGPVAASPTAPSGSSSPAFTAPPASATPAQDRIWVYFARDGLPPTGGFATGSFNDSRPEARILSRLEALRQAKTGLPAGATNAFAQPTPTQSGSGTFSMSAQKVQGDLATVEFDISGGWAVRGSAQSLALLQQLVYTITEEPGIRRALITEKGKPNAVIDQLVVDKPLTREDVFGYASAATPQSIEDAGDDTVADIVDWRASVDEVAPGLGRFVVELKPTSSTQPFPYPQFTAKLEQVTNANEAGKWLIRVELADAVWQQAQGEAFHCCPLKVVGKTPIRQVAAYPLGANPTPLPGPGTQGGGAYRGVGFGIYLDDARPWRAAILHNPLRLVVDVGGTPQATSDSVAVYAPRAGETGRTVTISGFARAFEANVAWRIKDSAGREVAKGFTTASLGTSPVWGSFQTTATIPANVGGNVTLEVFWPSPKDGEPMGLVQVPLRVR
ncbi:MAG: Gmad2 immunoglobulin-like domain-containing protein [Candidatus Limnocylindria bacterium]